MAKYILGFIGCGNMGGALVRACSKTVGGEKIAVCDYDNKKAEKFANELGVTALTASELVKESKFVVLGVKPQNMQETISPISGELAKHKDVVLITMAAGLSISAIQAFAKATIPTIRIMPNTPAALGEGMILYALSGVSEADEKTFLECFAKAGKIDKIPEDKIDAASALSGCGPAFVYAFAEALADGAVECGVPRDKAALYAAQTLKGAAEMLLEFGHPADLKDAVCSPGGTTIAGVHALENGGFRGITMDAVMAAYKRTLELKK
ncbi:MAG: pyrroline-5-carboxylate reductase [Clostridia bacterium]|nr:pyrroline-5-carboxylate reductase [Clostridia bacterium]